MGEDFCFHKRRDLGTGGAGGSLDFEPLLFLLVACLESCRSVELSDDGNWNSLRNENNKLGY